MPPGDPAGYLPNVLKARKRKGQKLYQPRGPRKGVVRSGSSAPGDDVPPPAPGHRTPPIVPPRPGSGRRGPFQSPAMPKLPPERKQPSTDRKYMARAKASMYAPDQGGPPPRPGSLQARQNRRDRARARRRSRVYRPLRRGTINSPESSSSRRSIT